MVVRADVEPELLTWARHRSGLDLDDLRRRFPKLEDWERGDLSPTLKQLEGFARATHTPVGFLFLDAPPHEEVPIPDYRTIADAGVVQPSPHTSRLLLSRSFAECRRTRLDVDSVDPVPCEYSGDGRPRAT